MRVKEFDIDPANVSLNGLGDDVTGASFTLTANSAGDGLAHQISILNNTATDHSGKTVTLVGTDADGKALTEVVTGPGASATVESSNYFLTVTSATPSATIGSDTFDIGWVDEVATKTIPLNWRLTEGATYSVDVTGTINYTVQELFSPVQDEATPAATGTWHNLTALASKTADLAAQGTTHATAVRLIVNSYIDTAEIQFTVGQG